MSTSRSALLKRDIEATLARRIPGALSPFAPQAPRLVSCGHAAIDTLLGGGLPVGGVTELTGLAGSGRTSLGLCLLSGMTQDSACAWIDVGDSFDPRSAAATGIHLRNLLWVRLAGSPEAERPAPMPAAAMPDFGREGPGRMGGRSLGCHPRQETAGVDHALVRLQAQKQETRLAKAEGTPGFPNQRLGLVAAPEEQVRFEHFNARRADASDPLRQANQQAAAEAHRWVQGMAGQNPAGPGQREASGGRTTWTQMDRAIRATDQILQAGGFRVVLLDLGSVPPAHAMRIPAATWFRFRKAAQESDAIVLLLTQAPCARSSAVCVLDCTADAAQAGQGLLSGLAYSAEVARQRLGPSAKKSPGRVATWDARFAWMHAVGQ